MEKFTYFVNEPNKKLFCPICLNVYDNPVLTDCGHTFCKQCILNQNDKCPIDGNQCKLKLINRNIAEQIEDLTIYCTYAIKLNETDPKALILDENSCTVTVNYGKRNEHESQCIYRIVKCPNSPTCPLIRFKDLEEHLKQCNNVQCPYSKYSCTFSGFKNDVDEHLKSCRYENFKEVLAFYDDKLNSYEETIQELHQTVAQKDEQIQSLTNYISTLSLRMDNFEKKVEDKFNILDDNQQHLINEINKEYKRLGDEINYLKLKFNEIKPKQIEPATDREREPQTTVKCLGTYVGHHAAITCLVCYNDNLISGSLDDLIKIWDTTSKYSCIKTLEGNKGGIRTMTLKDNILYTSGEKDGKIIVSLNYLKHLYMIWNLDTNERIKEWNYKLEIYSIIAYENKIIVGGVEIINVHDEITFKLIKELKEEQDTVVCALKINEKYLYSGSFKALKIWNMETFNLAYKVALPGRLIYSIVFYARNLFVANDNTIYVLDSKNYQIISTLNGHSNQIIDLVVAHSNLGDKLFSASKDRTLRVWSLEFLICSQILHRHEGNITSLASIQNRVFSGATDKQIKVWQINAFGRNI